MRKKVFAFDKQCGESTLYLLLWPKLIQLQSLNYICIELLSSPPVPRGFPHIAQFFPHEQPTLNFIWFIIILVKSTGRGLRQLKINKVILILIFVFLTISVNIIIYCYLFICCYLLNHDNPISHLVTFHIHSPLAVSKCQNDNYLNNNNGSLWYHIYCLHSNTCTVYTWSICRIKSSCIAPVCTPPVLFPCVTWSGQLDDSDVCFKLK